MKIAFFGTPDFSARIFEKLLEYNNLDITLAVSQADKPVGRKRDLLPTKVKEVALKNDIKILQPEKLRNNEEFFEELRKENFDFIVVVAYGKIIPKEVLDAPKYGCINIHGSILPDYRGASPVQESLKNGDKTTGLTIMYMNEKMDEGDMLSVGKVDVDIMDRQVDIFDKFVNIGPSLLVETLEKIVSGEVKGQPQNHEEATYCSLIKKEDGEIDFNDSAENIYNKFRAYSPWPGIFSYYKGKKFTIENCFFDNDDLLDEGFEIGDVVEIEYEHRVLSNGKKDSLAIVCKHGSLILFDVKLEGKKSMPIDAFINGQKDFLDYNFLENA